MLLPFVVKSMAFAPALKLEVPPTVKAAVCVIPLPLALRLPLTLLAPSAKAILLAMLALLLLPVVVRETAPVKALPLPFVARSIALAPALKLDVPETVIAPVWEIAPELAMFKLPTTCEMPAMLKAPLFVSEILPLLVLVAFRLEIVLALFNVVPPTEATVSKPPLIVLVPVSATVPAVPVSDILPAELERLPVERTTLCPAVRLIKPEVLMLLATVRLLDAPVSVALNEPNGLVPPIVPKLKEPAPELRDRLLLPATLLSVAPMLKLPPFEASVLLPLTVVAPRVSAVLVVLMLPSTVVPDGLEPLPVVVKPPVNVRVSAGALPRATVPVFRKLTALVIAVVEPFKATL